MAEGLAQWLRCIVNGEAVTPEAEAAGLIVAETILMHRAVLKSKFKK